MREIQFLFVASPNKRKPIVHLAQNEVFADSEILKEFMVMELEELATDKAMKTFCDLGGRTWPTSRLLPVPTLEDENNVPFAQKFLSKLCVVASFVQTQKSI